MISWWLKRLWKTGIVDRVEYAFGDLSIYIAGTQIKPNNVNNRKLWELLSSLSKACEKSGIKELVAQVDKRTPV